MSEFRIATIKGTVRHFTGLSGNRCPALKRTDPARLHTLATITGTIRDLIREQWVMGEAGNCTHCVRAAREQERTFVEMITGASGAVYRAILWSYHTGTGSGTQFISTTDRNVQFQYRWNHREDHFTVDRLTSYGSNTWETVETVPVTLSGIAFRDAAMVDRMMRDHVRNYR